MPFSGLLFRLQLKPRLFVITGEAAMSRPHPLQIHVGWWMNPIPVSTSEPVACAPLDPSLP
jgi:hypothetical protein